MLGLGILLKGPIAPMVPLLAGLTLAAMDRPAGSPWWKPSAPWLWSLRAGWGIPLMVLCAAPWFVAIGIATEGRFFAEAIGGDMLDKVCSGEEAHWGPPGMYAAIFGITAFPSAWIVLRALPGSWADRMQAPVRFLLAWAVPTWLLFEAVATKLPHYTLPAFPALMLLGAPLGDGPAARRAAALGRLARQCGAGRGRDRPAAAGRHRGVRRGSADRALRHPRPRRRHRHDLGAGAHGPAARNGAAPRWPPAILAVPVYASVLEGVIPRLQAVWLSPRLAAQVAAVAPGLPARNFGVVGHHEPSLQFAMGGDIRLLRDGAAAAAFLAEAPGRIVAVNDRQEAAFRRDGGGTRPGGARTRHRHRAELRPRPLGGDVPLQGGIDVRSGSRRWSPPAACGASSR